MLGYKLFKVSENSMLPTLKSGNILLVKTINKKNRNKIQRNDIVVFKDPILREKPYIKRVIGVPGEKVQILNTGVLIVNNKTINTPFDIYSSGREEIKYEWNLKGEFVMLGDNREESIDSRKFGAINYDLIIGKVIKNIWPMSK